MADMSRDVIYTFRMIDNVSDTTERVKVSAGEATEATDELTNSQGEAGAAVEETTQSLMRQDIQAIKSITIFNTLKTGITSIASGFMQLGLLSDENSQKLMKFIAVFRLLAGGAQIVKALSMATNMYRAAQTGAAVVEGQRAVMNNPWKAALIGVSLGAAAGIAGGLMIGGGGSTTTNNEIVVENAPEQVQTATEIYATIGGGSL